MDPSSLQAYSRRDRSSDFKRRHVDSVHVNVMADSDSQYVFDALHAEFGLSRSDWNKPVPTLKYKMKLPSIVSPLKKLTQSAVIIFFPRRLPSANDVAQWIKSILGGCFIEGVFFASRGFYKVHLTDHMYKQKLLEASLLFYGKQMVHVLPWSPSKDYHNLIRHSCPVWVEVVNFPDYMREELPGLAASLGKVICPPRPTGNRNRFCILWDTDKPAPPSIAIEVEDVEMGETYFDLKWGVFAGACFTCHTFGHLASECPHVVHKPPPNAIPQSDIVPVCLLTEKAKTSGSVVSDANLKSAPQLVAQSSKARDKGKALMADAKKADLNGLSHVNKWRLFWDYVNTMHHVVCLQEHNQHLLASQSGFFAGYHIFYAGSTNFSGVVMLVHHELNPHLTYNDPDGRWMINVIYWRYSEATTRAIIADGLSDPWELGRSVRQGCLLSALLYAISTHPLLLYVDKMVDTSLLHGVQFLGSPSFLPQAYADDSFFMPKNDRADLQALMKILSDFGLAAGLHINFKKSILLPLNSCDWHSVLWLGQLLSPHDVIRHLGYPIGWFITMKQQMEWVIAKLTQKLRYWKLSTWPLHVRQ
ncbi:hypothetical protein L7F22_038436 [Adiantum nelumboides]|nr:hypothetical protein [Adiantum nelumboides]